MKPSNALLSEVVAEMLEQFAFLFGEPDEGDPVSVQPVEYLEATIGYRADGERGTLYIAAPKGLCREMAGNVLGLEGEEIPADAPADALKELSNILIGLLTARALGVGVPCALDPPEARTVDAEEVRRLAGVGASVRFRIDENLFVAALDGGECVER